MLIILNTNFSYPGSCGKLLWLNNNQIEVKYLRCHQRKYTLYRGPRACRSRIVRDSTNVVQKRLIYSKRWCPHYTDVAVNIIVRRFTVVQL